MSSADVPTEWQPLIKEFERRRDKGRSLGGEKKVSERASESRKNARELIALLADDNSFMELGTLVGGVSYNGEEVVACDGLVGGLATIDGRSVVLAAEDFTSKGGSIGHGTNAKRVRLAHLAVQEKAPYILMLDGAGARVTAGLERHPYSPSDLIELAQLVGKIPTIALIYGASAGHSALSGMMMDFVVMLEDATLFSAGPPLVAAALGEIVSKEELGSAQMHASISGNAHNVVSDEKSACQLIQNFLSFLPMQSNTSKVIDSIVKDKPANLDSTERSLNQLMHIIPSNHQQPYDMHKVIAELVDNSDFLEFQPSFGRSIILGFARLGGQSIAVVANQPTVYAGSITHDAADKATHFLTVVNSYQLPVVFLADNPGIMSGTQAEQDGTLKSAAKMYIAQANLQSPKLHVTLRKAFGFGSSLMAMNPFDRQTLTLALPGITVGGIPAKGGGNAAKINEDTALQLAAAEASGSWTAGDTMAYDEIIDPREMRNALIKGLKLAAYRLK
jgi:acetyl-CoA carboxylase carboxyltransferase component